MKKRTNPESSQVSPAAPDVQFFTEVSDLLQKARNTAYRAINSVMLETYWQVGRRIVQQEQKGHDRAGYGEQLIVNLARHLGESFGKGFSVANLWNFRQFYLTYPEITEFSTHCVGNLSWTHVRLIMRLESKEARAYYLRECAQQNWSSRLLERNIKSGYYQRLLSTQQPEPMEIALPLKYAPSDFIKDPYVLEFLDAPESLAGKESVLEAALISNMQQFLLELGKGFSFVARQMRVSTETSHFYVDLVFYNYILKCFVMFDLKTFKLTHQDIGQMDMYVRMFDDLKRGADDNPTIGVILCADKDETLARYSVLKDSRQIFASKYRTVLPSEDELAAMLARGARQLPPGEPA